VANVWVVRAGRGGESAEEFVSKNVVALGWNRLGAIKAGTAKEQLLDLIAAKYPDSKAGTRGVWASQLLRFANDLQQGDTVVTYDANQRVYITGSLTGGYEWSPDIEAGSHVRKVKWTGQVPRDALSVETRNTLGAIMTLFKLNGDAWRDLEAHVQPLGSAHSSAAAVEPTAATPSEVTAPSSRHQDPTEVEDLEATARKADLAIEDALNKLGPYEMQDLVAGILRAMGYKTRVSPPGPDGGIDIFASPDGLGLQEPRIFVEVKHRDGAMGADKIRAFLGAGRKPGDRCLYVSTGGFTKDARSEARHSQIPITLINMVELRQLLLDHYERMDAESRALIPLRKFYLPAWAPLSE